MLPLDKLKDALVLSAKQTFLPDPRGRSIKIGGKTPRWNPSGQILGSFITSLRRNLIGLYTNKYTKVIGVVGKRKVSQELPYDAEINNEIIRHLLNKNNWHMPLYLKEKMVNNIKADDWSTLKKVVGISRAEYESSLKSGIDECKSNVHNMSIMLSRATKALESAESLVEDLERMEKELND